MFKALKGKRIYSILNNKCPICQEGDFYCSSHAYDLKNFSKNYERCSVCDHKFEMETGFFYGAMYVSYALAVAISVSIFVAIAVLFPSSAYYVYIIAILIGLVGLMPVTFRLSRLIWMNLFFHYDPNRLSAK